MRARIFSPAIFALLLSMISLGALGCRNDWQQLNGDIGALLNGTPQDLAPPTPADGFFPDATVSVGSDPNVDFDPASVTITAQYSVTWIWRGGTHSLVSDSKPPAWDPTSAQSNGSAAQIFTTPGTYPYHCGQHPAQTGTVIVVP